MAGLSVRVLSDEEVQWVHETSLRVLFEISVDVCDDEIRGRLLLADARPGPAAPEARVEDLRRYVEKEKGRHA